MSNVGHSKSGVCPLQRMIYPRIQYLSIPEIRHNRHCGPTSRNAETFCLTFIATISVSHSYDNFWSSTNLFSQCFFNLMFIARSSLARFSVSSVALGICVCIIGRPRNISMFGSEQTVNVSISSLILILSSQSFC